MVSALQIFPWPVSSIFIYPLYLYKRHQLTCINQNTRHMAQVHICYERWASFVGLSRHGMVIHRVYYPPVKTR